MCVGNTENYLSNFPCYCQKEKILFLLLYCLGLLPQIVWIQILQMKVPFCVLLCAHTASCLEVWVLTWLVTSQIVNDNVFMKNKIKTVLWPMVFWPFHISTYSSKCKRDNAPFGTWNVIVTDMTVSWLANIKLLFKGFWGSFYHIWPLYTLFLDILSHTSSHSFNVVLVSHQIQFIHFPYKGQ